MSGKDSSKKSSDFNSAVEAVDATTIASQLAQNPGILAAVQRRCTQLIGESSGYVESLPPAVKRRVHALKNLQVEYTKVEQDFYLEVAALEAKFAAKYKPLADKRSDIIVGKYEPTDKESEWVDEEDEDADKSDDLKLAIKDDVESPISGLSEDVAAPKKDTDAAADKAKDSDAAADKAKDVQGKEEDAVTGIPDFWLTVFKNTDILEDMVKEHDEPLFSHLADIKSNYADDKGLDFTLEFHFSDNEYFTNKVLTKRYTVECKVDDIDPFSFEGPAIVKAAGCEIDWKKGKNLTVKTVKKKQRHKGRGQTRTVTKTIPNESFFNFFSPPDLPSQNDDEEDDEDFLAMETLEADFQRAEFLKDRVLPQAVLYFTGEALDNDSDDGEEEEDDDNDDHDYDDDDDDDPEFDPSKIPKGQKPAECKQQ